MMFLLYLLFFFISGMVIPLALWAMAVSSVQWPRYAAVAVVLSAIAFSLRI